MGKLLITRDDRNNSSRYSDTAVCAPGDDISELLQKRRLGVRKPPFYPLNYGDGMKAKVRRMKEEVQRSGSAVRYQFSEFSAVREFPVQTAIGKFNSAEWRTI